jgi:hypothetical protein
MPGAGPDPVADEVRALLHHLPPAAVAAVRERIGATEALDDVARWADSGAMALTGRADGPPLLPRAPVASRLAAAQAVLAGVTDLVGRRVDVDVPALLGERAALRGLTRAGATSVGGSTRLLRAADGWVAVSLPRADDWSLVPAWLQTSADDWPTVTDVVAGRHVDELRTAAAQLGLAVGAVPPSSNGRPTPAPPPWRLHLAAAGNRRRPRLPLRVVDLSSLWAGPLCAQLLAETGAEVVTLEDPDRADGARRGDPDLHRLLHMRSTLEPVRLSSEAGRRRVRELVGAADIVVTSARRRALRHLGLDPFDHVGANPSQTWVAVTGYGLTGEHADAVGFGDDAAAAGGLLASDAEGWLFCADAVADPCTGVLAAVAALGATTAGGAVVDIALRDVAAHLGRGPHRDVDPAVRSDTDGWVVATQTGTVAVAPPRARVTAAA